MSLSDSDSSTEVEQQRPDWCAAAFIVRNAEGKRRVVIDLRFINSYLANNSVTFDSLKSLKEMILPDDFMISMDLTAGYHHVSIHRQYRNCLGFEIAGLYLCTRIRVREGNSVRIINDIANFIRLVMSPCTDLANLK